MRKNFKLTSHRQNCVNWLMLVLSEYFLVFLTTHFQVCHTCLDIRSLLCISVFLHFSISDFGRLDFKTEDYIPSSSVSHSDIRNSPSLPGSPSRYPIISPGVSLYTHIHHCHCISYSDVVISNCRIHCQNHLAIDCTHQEKMFNNKM